MTSLIYNGTQINERNEMLSLTDMWRAAGGSESQRPSKWREIDATKIFIDYLESTVPRGDSELIQALNEGGDWNTWAHWQIGLAYAKYLSPAFHAWCNQVVRNHMEGKTSQAMPQPPEQIASAILRAELEIAALLEVPKHIAQVEAVKAVERRTGLDYSVYLLSAPAQSNIPAEEIMYEPNDMARVIGLVDGAQFNLWLKNGGYQVKTAEGWVPTEAGAPYCVTHQWKTQYKTGQNLKWSKKFVLSLLPKDWQVPG